MATEWMNDSLVKSQCLFPEMLCRRPSTCLSRATLHPAPPALHPLGWPVGQPQPPSSLASPSIWQLGWVCNRAGCDGIGCVLPWNTFSVQFPSLGSTNSSPTLLLQAQGLWGLPGATSHRYYITPYLFPKLCLHLCIINSLSIKFFPLYPAGTWLIFPQSPRWQSCL